jgi:hypothetical protein
MRERNVHFYFPPHEIGNLPSWRFELGFELPRHFPEGLLKVAIEKLKHLELRVVAFPQGVERPLVDEVRARAVFAIEVPPVRRAREGSLEDWVEDVSTLLRAMTETGFGDLFVDSVDCRAQEFLGMRN